MLNRSYIQDHKDHPHYYSDSEIRDLIRSQSDSRKQQALVPIFKILSDPTRLSIYLLLQKVEELPVSDIANILDLSQSATSHALSDLKKLNLVECHQCGQLRCYALKDQKKSKNTVLSIFQKVFFKK